MGGLLLSVPLSRYNKSNNCICAFAIVCQVKCGKKMPEILFEEVKTLSVLNHSSERKSFRS
jgi:hypothetical protein